MVDVYRFKIEYSLLLMSLRRRLQVFKAVKLSPYITILLHFIQYFPKIAKLRSRANVQHREAGDGHVDRQTSK